MVKPIKKIVLQPIDGQELSQRGIRSRNNERKRDSINDEQQTLARAESKKHTVSMRQSLSKRSVIVEKNQDAD